MTGSGLVTKGRQFSGDDGATSLWTDAKWIAALNDGLDWFASHRPESKLGTTGLFNVTLTAAASPPDATVLWLPDVFEEALLAYMLERYFLSDAADARDRKRASEYGQRFDELVGLRNRSR